MDVKDTRSIENLTDAIKSLQQSQSSRLASERVVIFIDRSNLDHTLRRFVDSTRQIDYLKLPSVLGGSRFLKQVRIYYSEYDPFDLSPEERQEWDRRHSFYRFLECQGYCLRGVRRRAFNTPSGRQSVEKGLDVALALDMYRIGLGNRCDTIVLVSGDDDYREVIADLQREFAIRVEVAFFPGQTATDLRNCATKFVNLLDFKDRILRDLGSPSCED